MILPIVESFPVSCKEALKKWAETSLFLLPLYYLAKDQVLSALYLVVYFRFREHLSPIALPA